jgi:hypothetical protein
VTPDVARAVYDRLLPGWRAARLVSGQRRAKCPLHDDEHPSFDVHETKLVWICRAGCGAGGAWELARRMLGGEDAKRLLAELDGGSTRDRDSREPEQRELPPEDLGPPTDRQIEALRRSRRLRDRETLIQFRVHRLRCWGQEWLGLPTLAGGRKLWAIDSHGKPRLDDRGRLVRRNVGPASLVVSPALRQGPAPTIPRLWDVEGESDLVAAVEAGLTYAIAGTVGAGSLAGHDAHRDRLRAVRPAEVCVVGDRDAAGHAGAEKRATWWLALGVPVRIVPLPEALGPTGDLRDFVNGRPAKGGQAALEPAGDAAALNALADGAALREPASAIEMIAENPTRPGASVASVALVAAQWPHAVGPAAYHGPAGDFVRLVEPHTEADPVGLLLQLLTMFGSAAGRSAYFVAEADHHFPNLFVASVGATSKGRKGTSFGQTRTCMGAADPRWLAHCITSGLSSGEGLIWAVRDPIYKKEPIREHRRVVAYQDVLDDEGVQDKRLLVVESELASTLRVLGRDGNTLSALIRQAWDTGDLSTLTKNNRAKATGAHISIIGHITTDELRRYLDATEAGNGFANRFLWACVRRSKQLPEGGNLDSANFAPLHRALAAALDHARRTGEVRRDDTARGLWREVYPELSEGRPGLLGAVISRAEAQVMRLALIYALLDRAASIQEEHLRAALEVWRYCEDSARFIFGDSLGDPVADELLRLLRAAPEGLTRTAVRDQFGRHGSHQIGRALASLGALGLVECRPEATGGRPAERWFASGGATKATKATEVAGDQTSVASVAGVSAVRCAPLGVPL